MDRAGNRCILREPDLSDGARSYARACGIGKEKLQSRYVIKRNGRSACWCQRQRKRTLGKAQKNQIVAWD